MLASIGLETKDIAWTLGKDPHVIRQTLYQAKTSKESKREEMSDQEKKLGRLVELTEALLRTRISELLEKELDDPKKKELYRLTGKKNTRELSDLTGLSTGAISGLWQRWYSKGILKKQGKFYIRIFEEETEDA